MHCNSVYKAPKCTVLLWARMSRKDKPAHCSVPLADWLIRSLAEMLPNQCEPLHCCSTMQSNVLHWLLVLEFTGLHCNSLDFTGQCKLDIQLHFCNVLLLCSFFQSKVGSAPHCIETFFSLNTIHPLRETSILGADLCLAISSFWDWDLKLHFSNCPVFQAGHFHNLVACGIMWGVVTVVRTSYFYMWCCGISYFVVLWCVDHTSVWCIAILSLLLIKELQPSSELAMTKLWGNAPSTCLQLYTTFYNCLQLYTTFYNCFKRFPTVICVVVHLL